MKIKKKILRRAITDLNLVLFVFTFLLVVQTTDTHTYYFIEELFEWNSKF